MIFQARFEDEKPVPEYARAIAVALGGTGLFLSQISAFLSNGLLLFGIFGAALAFFWPQGGWRWGIWLILPMFLLNFIDVIEAGSPEPLLNNLFNIGEILIVGCAASFIASRFILHR